MTNSMPSTPRQTICLVDGKVNVGEPCTLLDVKRLIDSYPRSNNSEIMASVDDLLSSLGITSPAWKPSAFGAFMFLCLCDKAPEDQSDSLVQVVLNMLCVGFPDIVLSDMHISFEHGTMWAGNSFEKNTDHTGGISLTISQDSRFSDAGAWIGGPPPEVKCAVPEHN